MPAEAGPGRVARLLIGIVRGYRLVLSPWLGQGCRFEPSCSAYALQAIERHGAATGSRYAVGRVLRCHPFCAGGLDPVPPSRRLGATAPERTGGDLPSHPLDVPTEAR